MSTVLKIALLAALLVYIGGLTFTYYSNIQFQQKVNAFDLDNNGLIDNEELTKDAIVIARQQAKRKTTKQAVIVLIPVALVIGLIVYGIAFLFRKIKSINDNEILYKNKT